MPTTGPNYVGTNGSSGTTSAGVGWTTLANAEGPTSGNYAQWINVSKNAVGTWQGTTFGLSIPAGNNVDSVLVEVQHNETSTTIISTVTGQLFKDNGATALESPTTFTKSTTDRIDSFTVTTGLVASDIPNLAVKTVSTRSNSTSSGTQNIDWARVTVTYSAPPPAPPEVNMVWPYST